MATPDGSPAGPSGPLGLIDRVGFQRWAAILFVADLIGIVVLLARLDTSTTALLVILQIAVLPPVLAALIWSLRDRLGVSDPARIWITAVGLLGAGLELVNALIGATGAAVDGLLGLLVLLLEGGWLVAFGICARRARTFADQSPALAVIAGGGLVVAGLGRILPSGATSDAVQLVASVFVLAEYVWLFRLARSGPAPAFGRV
jgi:hypothetical protein